MSSLCAPRQSTWSAEPVPFDSSSSSMMLHRDGRQAVLLHRKCFSLWPVSLPDFPRGFAPIVQLVELLPVFERVHAGPVAVVWIGEQLFLGDQPLERLLDELLARLQVREDVMAKDKEAAVDPQPRLADRPHIGNDV